ncbi:MAG TPA: hypothetical protein VGE29_18870 [Prosthecobacter sp.]
MKTPRHPVWIILLAVLLSFSSGFRLMDYIVYVNHFSTEPVFDPPGAAIFGAMMLPFFMVPWVGFWFALMANRYPPRPISLFFWFREKHARQFFWTLLFGLQALLGMTAGIELAGYSLQLARDGCYELAVDAACNAMTAWGDAYLWACLRALSSYRLSVVLPG